MSGPPAAAEATNGRKPVSPWAWVPSLYFAEGVPYFVVMTLAVVLYKRLGISNKEIALYTSWLYLPWVIKPLWSPLVDAVRTKRFWILATQLLMGVGFAALALALPVPDFFRWSLAVFWLLAFTSATHDIAADGFYLLGLSGHQQAWFVGIRSTAYRLAMIGVQGLLIMFAGSLEGWTGLPVTSVAVRATADGPGLPSFDADALGRATSGAATGIGSLPQGLSVGLKAVDPAAASALIDEIGAWNVRQGFYAAPTSALNPQHARWPWLIAVEKYIQQTFGDRDRRPDGTARVGNVGIIPFRLAQPLVGRETLVVHVGRTGGSGSIQVVEGDRFQLNAANSHLPFFAVVQLDQRLTSPVVAEIGTRSGNISLAWTVTFYAVAALFLAVWAYHLRVLPYPSADGASVPAGGVLAQEMGQSVGSFFRKPGIVVTILFLLLYRFAEAQLVKMSAPFLLDSRDVGGLGLTTAWVGFIYGTVGVILLTAGGLLGGFVAARYGLRASLAWMVFAINGPNVVYTLMAYFQPKSHGLIAAAVGLEQFGYGFGFTAYLLYCMYVSQGKHETVHYALCTGFMALGMMLPGMFSGWLQELVGYRHFFVWVLIATIPSFVMTRLISVDAAFGKDKKS